MPAKILKIMLSWPINKIWTDQEQGSVTAI